MPDKYDFGKTQSLWTSEFGCGLDGECPDCGHSWDLHGDRYGCQAEPGDTFDGSRAKPPCGCKSVAADVAAGSTSGREEQGAPNPSVSFLTACQWLRKVGAIR
jgi:hypothetical protein